MISSGIGGDTLKGQGDGLRARLCAALDGAANKLDLRARNFHISMKFRTVRKNWRARPRAGTAHGVVIARPGVCSARGSDTWGRMAVAGRRGRAAWSWHRGVEYQGSLRRHGHGRPRQVWRRRLLVAVDHRRAPADFAGLP